MSLVSECVGATGTDVWIGGFCFLSCGELLVLGHGFRGWCVWETGCEGLWGMGTLGLGLSLGLGVLILGWRLAVFG